MLDEQVLDGEVGLYLDPVCEATTCRHNATQNLLALKATVGDKSHPGKGTHTAIRVRGLARDAQVTLIDDLNSGYELGE